MSKYLFVLIILFFVSCSGENIPKDAELITTYKKNKKIFEEIKSKICRTRYSYINVNGNVAPKSIPNNELEEYYGLFERIGVKSVSKSNECNISLDVWSEGFIGTNRSKGFIFNPIREGILVDNLDNKDIKRQKSGFYFKHIEGDWYLYFYHYV